MRLHTLFFFVILFPGFWLGTSACLEKELTVQRNTDLVLKSVETHDELESTLQIDRARLESGPNKFLQATFTITNLTQAPIPFTFSSAQQYDLFVRDDSGKEYWKWSEGRFFAAMIVEKELQDQWEYTERVPTVDSEGNPLAPGTYMLVARLMADRDISNSLTFEITD